MGEISAKIDTIIAARKSKVSILQRKKEEIMSIRGNVDRFKLLQENIRKSPEQYSALQGNGDVIDNITSISTDSFFEKMSKYTRELDRLIERVGRDSLNISFVGSAGHGKSLVMQKISGLSGNVIPSADGSDCTGAKSVISNNPSSEVTARITFFNQSEMIEIINKYLDYITRGAPEKLSISSVEEIRGLSSKLDYIENCAENDAKATVRFEHLKKYIEHYNEYYQCLGTTIEVKEADIEKYVAQYKSTDNEEKYYRYLSVKNANIMCQFPHDDVGRIVLIDTIGIGATSMGVEDDMLNAIENDSDAIIYMLRPDPLRPRLDEYTTDIWEKIKGRISAEYMKEMLFVVLNKVVSGKGENIKNIPEMEKTLSNPKYNHAQLLTVDCASDDDVRDHLLIPVLTRLSERIQAVDQRLIDKLNAMGNELRQAYNGICLQAEKAFVNSANEDMKRFFHNDIENTYKGMLGKLRDLYIHKYKELRNVPCEELRKECEQKLKNILTSVPTQDDIKALLNKGTINQHNAYEKGTITLRMRIIDDFTNLNTVLSDIVEKMKKEVIGIAADDGLLNRILPADSGVSSSEWIESFLSKTEAETDFPLIYSAFKAFEKYTINVQGFIIHEIRDKLDAIDLALNKKTPEITHGLDDKDGLADEIVEILKSKAFDIRGDIKSALSELYKVPNKSMFAAVTDLCDRLSFSKSDENNDVELEWRYLYENWMRQIWTEKYDAQSGLQQVAGEWNEVIRDLKDSNKPECFTI